MNKSPLDQDALDYHRKPPHGKLEITPTKPCLTQRDLALAYTPGVAAPCRAIQQNPEANRQFIAKIPLGRWGKPEEIGSLAVYLCSEEAGFITGTDFLIDGGWTAQ